LNLQNKDKQNDLLNDLPQLSRRKATNLLRTDAKNRPGKKKEERKDLKQTAPRGRIEKEVMFLTFLLPTRGSKDPISNCLRFIQKYETEIIFLLISVGLHGPHGQGRISWGICQLL
jgi:hypothetical protein